MKPPHQDVNEILEMLSSALPTILGERLVGVYLTGSLTYGDFDRGSSDIDLLVVLERGMTWHERTEVAAMHQQVGVTYPEWANRVEASYITRDMLRSVEPPAEGRPYVNGGRMWDPDPPYGQEWLLNRDVLYQRGVALVGPDFTSLAEPIDIALVREASRNAFFEEWEPLLRDASVLDDSHHQAYIALTVCRVLHRARSAEAASKRVAAAWVKATFPQWTALLDTVERWQYGEQLHEKERILGLIEFTAGLITGRGDR